MPNSSSTAMEESIRLLEASPERGNSTMIDRCEPHAFQQGPWTSVVDISYHAPVKAFSLDTPSTMRSTLPLLPRTNPSFEMAFFLRNTQPPRQGTSNMQAVRKGSFRYANGLRFLGLRRTKRLRGRGTEGSLEDFIPPEGVEQKISKDGRKYLHILTDIDEHDASDRQPDRSESPSPTSKPKISLALSDHTGVVCADAIDAWIASYSNHQQGLSFSSKEATRSRKGLNQAKDSGEEISTSEGYRSRFADLPDRCSAFENITIPEGENSCAGATDFKAALCSNPLTPEPPFSGITGQDVQGRSSEDALNETIRVRSAHIKRRLSQGNKHGNPKLRERPTSDRLAGQGMRRPSSREQSSTASSSPEPDGQCQNLLSDDEKDYRADSLLDTTKKFPVPPVHRDVRTADSITLARKNREEKIRARKLRDLQRSRRTIDEVVMHPPQTVEEDGEQPAPHDPQLSDTEKIQQPRLQTTVQITPETTAPPSASTDSSNPTPNYTTGYTPITGRMTLSPVMLVAEQKPMPRGRPIKKPPRLVLRERKMPIATAVAVRSGSESRPAGESRPSAEQAEDTRSGGLGSPLESPTPKRESRKKALGHSVAASRSEGDLHVRTKNDNLSAVAPLPSPLALAAAAGSRHGESSCVMHVPAAKKARIEARLGALERENRLLEAALMAVLRRAQRMDRDVCGCGGGCRSGIESGMEEDAGGRGSVESALQMYLGTGGRGRGER